MNNKMRLVLVLGILAASVLIACSDGGGPGTVTPSSQMSHPTKEYVLAQNTLAADSLEDFATLADAAQHQDMTGVLSLEEQGKAFMLAPGTRIMAGGITGPVCGGTVESGEFISKDVVLACTQLGE